MSEQDRVWRKGDPKWTYTEGETVPRYMWSQISMTEIVKFLNEWSEQRTKLDKVREIPQKEKEPESGTFQRGWICGWNGFYDALQQALEKDDDND